MQLFERNTVEEVLLFRIKSFARMIIGIAADDAEKVFEPFTKLNSFFDGAGCGLTVARSIARRLNGDVKFDTEHKGGARFIFTLPM